MRVWQASWFWWPWESYDQYYIFCDAHLICKMFLDMSVGTVFMVLVLFLWLAAVVVIESRTISILNFSVKQQITEMALYSYFMAFILWLACKFVVLPQKKIFCLCNSTYMILVGRELTGGHNGRPCYRLVTAKRVWSQFLKCHAFKYTVNKVQYNNGAMSHVFRKSPY